MDTKTYYLNGEAREGPVDYVESDLQSEYWCGTVDEIPVGVEAVFYDGHFYVYHDLKLVVTRRENGVSYGYDGDSGPMRVRPIEKDGSWFLIPWEKMPKIG